jgi:hypothetical protein
MVHIVAAPIIIPTVIVLGIINVGIMVHPIPILRTVSMPPLSPISLLGLDLLRAEFYRNKHKKSEQKCDPTGHGNSPLAG